MLGCNRDDPYRPTALGATPAAADGGTAGASAGGGGATVGVPTGNPLFPVTGINSGMLTITGVEPATGPFSGGTEAVVRGSGFDDAVTVRIGGVTVEPSQLSQNRISIVVPAGKVGPVDIEITSGDDTVVLQDGFIYNALAVSPHKGAASGGNLVDLAVSDATLPDDVIVEFDGSPCTDLRILSLQAARCKAPAHMPGVVDVVARSPSNSAAPLIAKQSYEFAETLDATSGGLSGGPIDGTINVTVVSEGAVGNVIPSALVLLGNDPRTSRRGVTDKRGSVTFSDVGLKGPVTVHATAKCFQRASIVDFDAKDVTVFLSPILDPACAADGSLSPGVRQLTATVTGELIFPGHKEFDVNTWDIVPAPKENEIRVAYIFTSEASRDARRVPPAGTDAQMSRLVEGTALPGKRGYPYRIAARAGGLAVYALAGLERTESHEFTPYVMGIAHNVVTAPGELTANVDMTMTITLDRELNVAVTDYPAATSDGPDHFSIAAYLDLGGEGLVMRDVNNVSLDTIERHTASDLFRFLGQPALVGGLSGASYYVVAGYYSREPSSGPYTRQRRTGVRPSAQPLTFQGFLGIPTLVAPVLGARLPDDRMLRFELNGPSPDLIVVDVFTSDSTLIWTEVLPGDARAVPLPDLSLIEGQTDLPTGFLRWVVTAIKMDDFRYNEFQYPYLASRYWTHDSANIFFARR